MTNDIACELFYELQEGNIYEGLKNWGEGEQLLDAFTNKLSLDIKHRNDLFDIIGDISAYSERYGFEQGLKIGLQLMSFAISGKVT